MIVLDTSALIWAITHRSTKKAHVVGRLQAIQSLGGPIVLPAPALSEFLVKVKTVERPSRVASLQKFLTILPFDYRAATACAELFGRPRRKGQTKQSLKIDAMIYAVAVARQATHFLYCDGGFDTLAGASPPVELVDVEKIQVQGTLGLTTGE